MIVSWLSFASPRRNATTAVVFKPTRHTVFCTPAIYAVLVLGLQPTYPDAVLNCPSALKGGPVLLLPNHHVSMMLLEPWCRLQCAYVDGRQQLACPCLATQPLFLFCNNQPPLCPVCTQICAAHAITLTYTSFAKSVIICSPATTITLTVPGGWMSVNFRVANSGFSRTGCFFCCMFHDVPRTV